MQRVTDEEAYTLIEALFHLTIVSLFIFMITIFFQWYSVTNEQVNNVNDLKWRQFSMDFQREISQMRPDYRFSYPSGNLEFYNGNDHISINYVNSVIRKQVNGAGHIPLLTNVRKREVKVENKTVRISVIFTDGLEREGEFILGVYEE